MASWRAAWASSTDLLSRATLTFFTAPFTLVFFARFLCLRSSLCFALLMADLWVANYSPPYDLLLKNKLDCRIEFTVPL